MYLVIENNYHEILIHKNQTKKQVKDLINKYKDDKLVTLDIYKVSKNMSVDEFQDK